MKENLIKAKKLSYREERNEIKILKEKENEMKRS